MALGKLLARATVCAKRKASLLDRLTPRAAICSRTMPDKVCPGLTEVSQAATRLSGAKAPDTPDKARVKVGAARVSACDPTVSGNLPLISVLFTWG